MPRQAHGRSLISAGKSRPARRKSKPHAALNALETAERQIPESARIRRSRLGEVEGDDDDSHDNDTNDGHSVKRRKLENSHGTEEDVEEGSDLEGGTWHTGVNDEDEDSDLDSDEAFGESDEERFADFTFRGSEKPPPRARNKFEGRRQQIDLDENEDSPDDIGEGNDDDDDDFGDDAVDLATAWDMDDDARRDQSIRTREKRKEISFVQERNHESDETAETSNSSQSETDTDGHSDNTASDFSLSEDEMQGDTAGLRSFIENLSGSTSTNVKSPLLKNEVPNGKPSRFGPAPSAKLSAADLLQHVKDPVQRQSLKILQSAEGSAGEVYRGGIPGKLSIPLAKRQQDRLDRGAAYDKSKETLNRWVDTVKQNRRAENLSFPLVDDALVARPGQKQLMPTLQSKPMTDLEATIEGIMQESGIAPSNGQQAEDQEMEFEELAERKLDIEEVRARRAQLRMARELLFREEIRTKRVKKIKSKAYRRVHRKERDRIEAQQRDTLAAAGLLNSDDEREKQDRRRAEERMGARHRESRWAKSAKQAGRTTWDEDARLGVSDMARKDDELRRRIQGKSVADSDRSGSESDSLSEYDADTDTEGRNLTNKLKALRSSDEAQSISKLGQMAFMQRAEAAQRAKNDQQILQLQQALDNDGKGYFSSSDAEQEVPGRRRFGARSEQKPTARDAKANHQKNEFEASVSDEDVEQAQQHNVGQRSIVVPEDFASQLDRPVSTRKTVINLADDATPKGGSKSINRRQNQTKEPKSRHSRIVEQNLDDYTSPSESEHEAEGPMGHDKAAAALAASIFAGPDDTIQEFTQEKAQLVEEEDDQVIDNTLPGWGSWAGAGISKREQKKGKGRFLTTVKGIAPEKRQDAKLERVIINEKQVKKNGKYLANELPHPFESRQQYERSLRLPIGPEWSTVKHYQDSIKPRILVKQGSVIRPMAKPIA